MFFFQYVFSGTDQSRGRLFLEGGEDETTIVQGGNTGELLATLNIALFFDLAIFIVCQPASLRDLYSSSLTL
jgi:hypothetical protein